MQAIISFGPTVLLAAWTLVASAYGVLFFRRWPAARRDAPLLLWGTLLLHLGYLVFLTVHYRQFPAGTVAQALTVVAFAVGVIYVFVEQLAHERSTGFWLVIQVWIFQLLGTVLGPAEPIRSKLFEHPLFALHVSFALLGYAAFAVAASYGFLFLTLYRELKGKRFSLFYGRLPPLQVLERMMTGALMLGFVALTGALIDGAVWLHEINQNRVGFKDPLVVMSVGTWILYGCALLLKKMHRWQGRQTAVASLTGLAVILVSLIGVNLFATGFHRAF